MSQFNATIDDGLLTEARQVMGMPSNKALLEYALQLVIALRSIPHSLSPKKQTVRYGRMSDILSPSTFEEADSFPAYEGSRLSLEDMDEAVARMAAQQK